MLHPEFEKLIELIMARDSLARAVATLPAGGPPSREINRAIARADEVIEEFAASLAVIGDDELVLPSFIENEDGEVVPRPGFPDPRDVDTR